jgi:hypothetical protein
MNPTLRSEYLFRFPSPSLVLAALPGLGPFYVQVRNRGGGLGKKIESLDPLQVPDLDFAFDPENGLGFAIRDLLTIHAGEIAVGSMLTYALDFEFAGFPGGLSLHKFPDMDGLDGIVTLVRDLPCDVLDKSELLAWRADQTTPFEICPCCQKRAAERARRPEDHALYRILRHAVTLQTPLEFRLTAGHVDMTSSFAPYRITLRNGFIILSDAPSQKAFHIDMRTVHALVIDVIQLDGATYSSLHLYDTLGNLNFHLMTEGPHHATIWRDLCETPS